MVMDEQLYSVGDRVDKMCDTCGEEHGHVVSAITKRGRVSRVSCPVCNTRSGFKSGSGKGGVRSSAKPTGPYDWGRTYRVGQTIIHPTYGLGEVMAVIDPQKMDVLFSDRMRRLVHSRAHATV
ncbi:MAG: hypothetical protein WKF30_10145 [Pyrinomonadaceae bacterium]